MSLNALVHEVGQMLGEARQLFGATPVPGGWEGTGGLDGSRDALSQANNAAGQTWGGAGGSSYVATSGGQLTALDSVIDADEGTTTGLGGGAEAAASGRSGMDAVIKGTSAGVAAIAPSTDTPAGRQQLVDHLQTQLQRAKALLQISEQRNMTLAQIIRTAAARYRNSPGPTATMSNVPAMSSPAMTPSIGSSASAAPALTRLIGLTHHRSGTRRPSHAQWPGLTLHSPVAAQTPGAEHIRAAIHAALDIKGITNPVARAHWEAGMMTVADRESGFNPNAVNRYDENARRGNPSEGAFQMIGTTFHAYHQPGTPSNNHDLIAQAAAFINYVRDHYGVAADGSNLAALVQQADPTRPPKGY